MVKTSQASRKCAIFCLHLLSLTFFAAVALSQTPPTDSAPKPRNPLKVLPWRSIGPYRAAIGTNASPLQNLEWNRALAL